MKAEGPVPFRGNPAVGHHHRLGGEDLLHPPEHGAGLEGIAEPEEVIDTARVKFRRQQPRSEEGLGLRAEDETILDPGVVERLDPHPVPSHEETAAGVVPDGKGEHAVQVVDAGIAMLLVEVQDDLRVGTGPEAVSGLLEAGAVLFVIVDLTVVGDPDRPVLIGHWLGTAIKIDDAEAPVGQSHLVGEVKTFSIRAPVAHGVGHPLQGITLDSELRRK